MKRKALLLLFTAVVAFAIPASADVFLLGFTGFDYDSAAAGSTHPLDVNNVYKSVGHITAFGFDACADVGDYVNETNNEYTYSIRLPVATSLWDGDNLEAHFADGRTRYYEDSRSTGTAAVYGINPENATSPSTFIDGTIALGGVTYGAVLTYTVSQNQGEFSGNMDLDEGTDLTYVCVSLRHGWIIGGLSGGNIHVIAPPNASVPQGYWNQVTGECRRVGPTPAVSRTWGAIKSLYR